MFTMLNRGLICFNLKLRPNSATYVNYYYYLTPVLSSHGTKKNYAMQYQKSTKIKLE